MKTPRKNRELRRPGDRAMAPSPPRERWPPMNQGLRLFLLSSTAGSAFPPFPPPLPTSLYRTCASASESTTQWKAGMSSWWRGPMVFVSMPCRPMGVLLAVGKIPTASIPSYGWDRTSQRGSCFSTVKQASTCKRLRNAVHRQFLNYFIMSDINASSNSNESFLKDLY